MHDLLLPPGINGLKMERLLIFWMKPILSEFWTSNRSFFVKNLLPFVFIWRPCQDTHLHLLYINDQYSDTHLP